MADLRNTPHKRLNILTGEWILVSPHRNKRPWQGKIESSEGKSRPSHDPKCYLCPGNLRAGGEKNPYYSSTYSFTNDFSALVPSGERGEVNHDDLIIAETESGICRVICFSPRHDLSIAEMEIESILNVIEIWISEYESLSSDESVNYITIFENKGELMGCSNPHPHGQIWAQRTIPNEPQKEGLLQKKYSEDKGGCLLCDYLKKERELNERIIAGNDDFLLVVPYWAMWPYETIILPKFHSQNILSLTGKEKNNLAGIIKATAVRYDNLFETSFPYSMGFHQAPSDNRNHDEWHWHIHFYPPLLRSSSVKKFMVGYEMLAEPQRDFTPEASAKRLRELPLIHYKNNEKKEF